MKEELALTETYLQHLSATVTRVNYNCIAKRTEKFSHGKQHFFRIFDKQYYAL